MPPAIRLLGISQKHRRMVDFSGDIDASLNHLKWVVFIFKVTIVSVMIVCVIIKKKVEMGIII